MSDDISFIRPAGPAERGFWSMHHFAGHRAACNESMAFEISGPVDTKRLARAAEHIVVRHEVFRTNYRLIDGTLSALVRSTGQADVIVHDAPNVADNELARAISADQAVPFDVEHDPLARIRIWRRSAERHVFLLTVHHLVQDWTTGILLTQEVLDLYAAELDEHVLPTAGAYSDHVRAHERRWRELEPRALEYWRALLPTTRQSRPMDPTLPGGRAEGRIAMLPVTVDRSDAAELQVRARELRVPLNVVMLAEWARALARPARRDPVAIGVLRSLRTAEHARTFGCFINSLPVFVHGGPDTPLADIVEQLRVQLKGIRMVQQYPVELLSQRFSQLGIAPGRPPFFDASFNYLPSDDSAFSSMITGRQAGVMSVHGLNLMTFTVPPHPGLVDFTLFLTETEHGPAGAVGYQLGAFDLSAAASLRRDFVGNLTATKQPSRGGPPS